MKENDYLYEGSNYGYSTTVETDFFRIIEMYYIKTQKYVYYLSVKLKNALPLFIKQLSFKQLKQK